MDAAISTAKEENLPSPTLLFEVGTPEIKVILNKGSVASVFFRNCELAPVVSIASIDCDKANLKEIDVLLDSLKAGCFKLLTHLVE